MNRFLSNLFYAWHKYFQARAYRKLGYADLTNAPAATIEQLRESLKNKSQG